eukprot:3104852-Rhodomonas_salina.2
MPEQPQQDLLTRLSQTPAPVFGSKQVLTPLQVKRATTKKNHTLSCRSAQFAGVCFAVSLLTWRAAVLAGEWLCAEERTATVASPTATSTASPPPPATSTSTSQR